MGRRRRRSCLERSVVSIGSEGVVGETYGSYSSRSRIHREED